jgi:hypothetical protein
MIKVVSQTYFSDVREVRKLNEFLKQNPNSKDIFSDYVKENFNATYERSYSWPSLGHFGFEHERDAFMFMLRWP